MSELSETFVNPDSALSGARQLHVSVNNLATKWATLSATIHKLNESKPWGTDEVGNEFNKNYLKDGSDDAPANSVVTAGGKIVERMQFLGMDVADAVHGTVDLDDLIGKWFGGNKS